MTRKPGPESDRSNREKRDTARIVERDQRTKALKKTLKKAASKDPPKEPKVQED
jgi:hypothetical protein